MSEQCVDCNQVAAGPVGTIYIRHKIGTRWLTSAICDDCWRAREGDRVPVRALATELGEEVEG